MDTTELPVGIRENIYSSSLDIFFKGSFCICDKEAELLIQGEKKKKNRKFPNVAISLEVSSDVWVMTDEALECKSRTARPICENDIRSLGNDTNFPACKDRQ